VTADSVTTCIVTGAAGFIGSNVVGEILRRKPGSHVIAVDDLRSGSFENLVGACDRIAEAPFSGDFIAASTAGVDWVSLLEHANAEAVYHLASITDTTVADEETMLRDNVEGFRPLLVACIEKGTPLVYASSAATYGSPPQGRDRVAFPEEAAGRPNNVYGFSKWVMENLHRRVIKESAGHTPQIVGLRYFNVFGPGEAHKGAMASMAFQLANQILSGGGPRIFSAGEQARDQVDVADVVDCTLAAAEPHAAPGVYNCGSGEATTFNEVVEAVRAGLGVGESDAPTEYFDMPESVRTFYQDFTQADLSKTEAALGWRPRRDPKAAISEYASLLRAGSTR